MSLSSQERDLLLGQQTQMLSQRCFRCSALILGPEKPWGQQKPLKSPNLPTDTSRAGCTPCPTKAPCSQVLLFPTKGCSTAPTWHPPSTQPSHKISVDSDTGSPATRKVRRISVNAPENQKNLYFDWEKGGRGEETKSLLRH